MVVSGQRRRVHRRLCSRLEYRWLRGQFRVRPPRATPRPGPRRYARHRHCWTHGRGGPVARAPPEAFQGGLVGASERRGLRPRLACGHCRPGSRARGPLRGRGRLRRRAAVDLAPFLRSGKQREAGTSRHTPRPGDACRGCHGTVVGAVTWCLDRTQGLCSCAPSTTTSQGRSFGEGSHPESSCRPASPMVSSSDQLLRPE
jgi:hypothetical protein